MGQAKVDPNEWIAQTVEKYGIHSMGPRFNPHPCDPHGERVGGWSSRSSWIFNQINLCAQLAYQIGHLSMHPRVRYYLSGGYFEIKSDRYHHDQDFSFRIHSDGEIVTFVDRVCMLPERSELIDRIRTALGTMLDKVEIPEITDQWAAHASSLVCVRPIHPFDLFFLENNPDEHGVKVPMIGDVVDLWLTSDPYGKALIDPRKFKCEIVSGNEYGSHSFSGA